MKRWNPLQPKRNLTNLSPRTHISHPTSIYNPYHPKNMTCQLLLYNWCSGLDYVNGAPIADLQAFLFGEGYIRQMGMTILQAVQYDPRKLKQKTQDNDRPTKMYVFNDPLDLKYGLEWIMSMWIWNLEWTYSDLIHQEDPDEIVLEIFDEIAAHDREGLYESFVRRVWDEECYDIKLTEPRPDWNLLWEKHGWEKEPTKAQLAPTIRSLLSEK